MAQFYRHFPITGPQSLADMADGRLMTLKISLARETRHSRKKLSKQNLHDFHIFHIAVKKVAGLAVYAVTA
jgi:hypothetical protein